MVGSSVPRRSAKFRAAPEPAEFPSLSLVGDFRILREVGHGGMGVVYEAEQISLGRRIASVGPPAEGATRRKALERLRREARARRGCTTPIFPCLRGRGGRRRCLLHDAVYPG